MTSSSSQYSVRIGSYPTREMLKNMSDQTARRKKNEETQNFFEEYSKFKTIINIERENLSGYAFKNVEKDVRITAVEYFNCLQLKSFVNQFNKNENDTGLDLKFEEINCSVHWNWE
jgi:hypothetical protein